MRSEKGLASMLGIVLALGLQLDLVQVFVGASSAGGLEEAFEVVPNIQKP